MRRVVSLFVGLLAMASVGAAASGGATQAQPRWVIRDVGTLGGISSFPYALNERGQVVGGSGTSTGQFHPFLWQNGRLRDLGTLGGTQALASGVNEHGQVVGRSGTATGEHHAFLWQRGRLRDLGTLGGRYGHASAINGLGQAARGHQSGVLTPDRIQMMATCCASPHPRTVAETTTGGVVCPG